MARQQPQPLFASGKVRTTGTDERLRRMTTQRLSTGVDWSKVSATSMRSAISVCIAEGAALMIGSAMGGRGVVLKIFVGNDKHQEYASSPEEVNDWLDRVIDALGSPSEDVRQTHATGAD